MFFSSFPGSSLHVGRYRYTFGSTCLVKQCANVEAFVGGPQNALPCVSYANAGTESNGAFLFTTFIPRNKETMVNYEAFLVRSTQASKCNFFAFTTANCGQLYSAIVINCSACNVHTDTRLQKSHLSAQIGGLAEDRTRVTFVVRSCANRSAIHYYSESNGSMQVDMYLNPCVSSYYGVLYITSH